MKDKLEATTAPTVTITQVEYEELLARDHFLCCLENAGVDNLDGYEYAQEAYCEQTGGEDE